MKKYQRKQHKSKQMFVSWSECSDIPLDLFCDPPFPFRLILAIFWLFFFYVFFRACTFLSLLHNNAPQLVNAFSWWFKAVCGHLMAVWYCHTSGFRSLYEPWKSLKKLRRQLWKQQTTGGFTAFRQQRNRRRRRSGWVCFCLCVL